MSQTHTRSLLNLTGDLFPSGETPPEQLQEVRVILLAALLAGETLDEIGPREFVGEPAGGAEDEIVALGDAPPPPVSRQRVVRRTTSIAVVDQVTGGPAWPWGQAPQRTIGPFQDRGGRRHWFDIYAPGTFFPVLVQGAAGAIALLPQGIAPTPAPGTFTVPAGSVWLSAPAILPAAPADSWVGLRIAGGSATPGGPAQFGAGGWLLRPRAGLTLRLTLDTQGLAGFPESVSIAISAAGIRISRLGPGSLTVFGTAVVVAPADGAPALDNALRCILFPRTLDPAGPLTAGPDRGREFQMLGAADIESAAWAVPVTIGPAAALADAEGPGALAITTASGFDVELPGTAGGSIALNATTFLVTSGRTTVFAGAAANPRATQIVEAWAEDRVARLSAVELNRDAVFPCWLFRLDSGAEAAVTRAQVTLHIDRPRRASGERLESRIAAFHILERDESGSRVALRGRQQIGTFRPFALALSNTLLTVAEPSVLELNGVLSAPGQMASGAIHLALPLYQLLPTLPDPYAANFDLKLNARADDEVRVVATVIWTEPFDADLEITLDPPPFNMQSLGRALPNPGTLRVRDELSQRFDDAVRQEIDEGLALLDVSSNAGQLGLVLGFGDQPQGGLSIRDLTLNVSGSNAAVFLLPQFQCEPVFNKANPRVPGETEKLLFFRDDGGPTVAGAQTVRLVPVRPVAVMAEVVDAYVRDQHNAAVRFTLPFGIQAVAHFNPGDQQFRVLPQLELVAPHFENFDGAPQLSLAAGTRTDGQVWIEGRALQLPNIMSAPPASTLGDVVGPAFNVAFATGVPVDRIGLSGYGGNIFSRWFLAAKDADVGITQVAFDAVNGRTAYERVMLTSYLLPCFARLVRTITLERYGSGSVVRWDSGWLATTPGLFERKNFTFHKCAVTGVHNIREIMDTDYTVTVGGQTLQAVYYDADIAIDGVIRGADSNGRVPARRHLGYVQLLTMPNPPPPPGAGPITVNVIDAAGLQKLFASQGRLGGPIDCQIHVGDSPHEMKVSGVFADNASSNQFSVGPYGAPAVHAAGEWSVVRVNNTTSAVEPVDAASGIPLVRAGAGPFRWADPVDLLQNSPPSDYAFLFSSGAQRILFARPKVEQAAAQITSVVKPLLADPYSLLKAPGLFPAAKDAIAFGADPWGLEAVDGALRLSPPSFRVAADKAGFSLLKTSSWGADLVYQDGADLAEFTIDSAADWTIRATGLQQVLTFPVIGEVMRVVHGIEAPAIGGESFPDPQVLFSGALDEVTDVLRMLREWAPNLPAPLQVDVGFEGPTFRFSAVADFNIADSEGNALDCGMGKLKGNLKLGAELSVEIFKRTTNGAIFFEVTGSWQQQIFPLIYGGGLLRFAVRADQDGKTTFELDAAVAGSVGGDLIPGLVSLEATAKYGYFLMTNPITPGFLVGIEGRAKLLSGLLGFKLGIEGRIGITRTTHDLLDLQHICKLHGEILVAGTVTVAWLVDERKSFRTHYDVDVDWKMALVAAKAGLLPVP